MIKSGKEESLIFQWVNSSVIYYFERLDYFILYLRFTFPFVLGDYVERLVGKQSSFYLSSSFHLMLQICYFSS